MAHTKSSHDPRTGPPDAHRPEAAQVGRLRFDDPAVEAEFRADYFAGVLVGVRFNMALGAALFVLWALVDAVVVPHSLWFTLPMRLGVACPAMLAVFLLSYTGRFERLMAPALVLVDLISGLVLIAIISAVGPDGHRYYHAGLVLATIGCCACPGLQFRASAAVSIAINLCYTALLRADASPGVFLNNSMFLATAELLAMSVAYTLEREHRSGFLQRRVIRNQAESLRAMLLEVERTARTDALTGLSNRRHFFDEAAARGGKISVIILDVDHFKSINDRFGHPAGDRVLRELARRIEASVRPGDLACRYGGEEFAVLLTGSDLVGAATIGERVRERVAASPFGEIAVTVSVGIASGTDEASAFGSLVDRADQALYAAKHAGRNRVRLWDRGRAGLLPLTAPCG